MGHLTLISEDVIGALEHYPPDIRIHLAQYAPQPEWDNYVGGRYRETKKKDSSLLGGGKPAVSATEGRGVLRWKVDEEDTITGTTPNDRESMNTYTQGQTEPQFRGTRKVSRESSADFGITPAPQEDDDESPSQVGNSYHECWVYI